MLKRAQIIGALKAALLFIAPNSTVRQWIRISHDDDGARIDAQDGNMLIRVRLLGECDAFESAYLTRDLAKALLREFKYTRKNAGESIKIGIEEPRNRLVDYGLPTLVLSGNERNSISVFDKRGLARPFPPVDDVIRAPEMSDPIIGFDSELLYKVASAFRYLTKAAGAYFSIVTMMPGSYDPPQGHLFELKIEGWYECTILLMGKRIDL